MKISFTNTVEDMVALNLQVKPSSSSRNTKIFFTILIPLVVLIGLIYNYFYLKNDLSYSYAIEILFCILWIIFYPRILDLLFKVILISKFKKANFENLALELSDEGIIKSSSSSIHKFKWSSIININVTDEHIFIHIKPNIGYSIPLKAFSSSKEKDSFIEYLYNHASDSFDKFL